jgi:hypothetical protein
VKGSSGSFNACRRRELEYGDVLNRMLDRIRRSSQIEDGEKLNDERGGSPCRSVQSETVPNWEELFEMGKREFLFFAR